MRRARGIGLRARAGVLLIAVIAVAALAAPLLAPNDPDTQFPDRAFAKPSRVHLYDGRQWHGPLIYEPVLTNRLLQRYEEGTTVVPLVFFTNGRLITTQAGTSPLLWLGGDSLGRDLFARLVYGARLSLGVAGLGLLGALAVGALVGAWAGTVGGAIDRWLMHVADFVIVLPGAYLVLGLRGILPLDLSTPAIFALMSSLFTLSAWPHVARGVRGIVSSERTRDYAEASRAAGASTWRLIWQLLPAARGFLTVEIVILAPALLVAEMTVSFLGLGFPPPTASWGTLLQDTQHVSVLVSAPWLLAPAAALFMVTLGLQLASGSAASSALAASATTPGRIG